MTEVGNLLIKDGDDDEYANSVLTYLALAIGRTTNSCSSFARWQNSGEFIAGVFARQALPMMWDSPSPTHSVPRLRIGWLK